MSLNSNPACATCRGLSSYTTAMVQVLHAREVNCTCAAQVFSCGAPRRFGVRRHWQADRRSLRGNSTCPGSRFTWQPGSRGSLKRWRTVLPPGSRGTRMKAELFCESSLGERWGLQPSCFGTKKDLRAVVPDMSGIWGDALRVVRWRGGGGGGTHRPHAPWTPPRPPWTSLRIFNLYQ